MGLRLKTSGGSIRQQNLTSRFASAILTLWLAAQGGALAYTLGRGRWRARTWALLSSHKPTNTSIDRSSDDARRIAELAELAGGLAHELRNPLSTMMINLKLLAEDLRDETADFHDTRRRSLLKVDGLRREADRLQQLFDEFLNLAGPVTLAEKEVNLGDLIQRLGTFLDPLLASSQVELTISVPSDEASNSVAICLGDENLLSQAVLNLAINAHQAMPDGGTLRIAAGTSDDDAWVTVTDTGVGIAPEDYDRVLKPFFSTKGKGTGLGLSITQRIIHEHGGTLTFSSELAKGTTFTVRLPATHPDNPTPPTKSQ